jgi:catechol 2,3-dioxygenase-like lactoylglutathione lyase family enzyme
MIDHMGINTADFPKSKAFYDAVFAALGGSLMMTVPAEYTGGKGVIGYGRDHPVFWVTEADKQSSQHVAFTARTRAEVHTFYAAALATGGRDNGGPGLRPEYRPTYYAAFVLDPDGNNIEAVTHAPE